MSALPGLLRFRPPDTPDHAYRIAGREVFSDAPLAVLDGFRSPASWPDDLPEPSGDGHPPVTTFDGRARLALGTWEVRCEATPSGYCVAVESVGSLTVSRAGEVRFEGLSGEAPNEAEALTALAPGLALAWAHDGLWILHAGAVRTAQGAVLLLGESGYGKSTLAAAFGDHRLADDCVPLALDPVRLLGPYPQPKLEDYGASMPDEEPIHAIVELRPDVAEEVRIETLPPAEAATVLVRHTVAGALLAPDAMSRHLADCSRLAESVPCHRLHFHQVEERIPEMVTALENL